MTLLEQAVAFRTAFNQEMLDGMVRYGFIKEKLFDMANRLLDRVNTNVFIHIVDRAF